MDIEKNVLDRKDQLKKVDSHLEEREENGRIKGECHATHKRD